MKQLILIPAILALTACGAPNGSISASSLPEAPIDEPVDEAPPSDPTTSTDPVATPTVDACDGNYLVGTWTHTSTASDVMVSHNPSETFVFNADCTGRNVLCEYDFDYPPEGYTAEFTTGLGWDGGPYNFRMRHTTSPAQTKDGCTQYQSIATQWHDCNISPISSTSMRMDCNGEVNSFIFERQ